MKTHKDEAALLHRGGKPTLADLLDELEFSPTKGMIDLNGARMVLTRATFGADLQDELVRRFGEREAMILMLRLGYRNGREDAEFIRTSWPNLDVGDAFTAGTRLHMMTGTVRVETLHNDFDFKSDRFSGDFLWHQSVEATEYQRRHGRAMNPVCWAQTGYAAGYASVFFRKLVLYKEVSCAAMGDKSCRVVGKTVDGWGRDDPFVRLFLDEVLATRAEMPSHPRTSTLTKGPSAQGVLEDLVITPVRRELERLAAAGLNALITGPEGSGCQLAARWLHAQRFAQGTVLRLFGDTDAMTRTLETVRDGLKRTGSPAQTLIIDSLDTLPDSAQIALIDLIRTEGQSPDNLMVIGLSRKPLSQLRALPGLRAELLFALSVLPIAMPSLAARTDDLSLIADVYLSHLTARSGIEHAHLAESGREAVRRGSWPGNLPELRAALYRAALTAADPRQIGPGDFTTTTAEKQTLTPTLEPHAPEIDALWASVSSALDQGVSLDDITTALQSRALDEAGGNVSQAARRLGLSRATLDYRLKAGAKPDE